MRPRMIQGSYAYNPRRPWINAANYNTNQWQMQRTLGNGGNMGMSSGGNMGYGRGGMMGGGGGRLPPQWLPGQMAGQQQMSGGAGNNALMQLLASGQQAQLAANNANENRFQEIMKGYLKRYDKGMELADARQGQAYREMAGNASQDMVNRGMFQSTEAARKMFDSFETSKQIPLAQHNATSADPLMFAERREDVGPNLGQMMQLAQMAGQSQSGIPGQSSSMHQGVNIGSYPASFGLNAARQRGMRYNSAPRVGAPIHTGTFNPFPGMAGNSMQRSIPQRGMIGRGYFGQMGGGPQQPNNFQPFGANVGAAQQQAWMQQQGQQQPLPAHNPPRAFRDINSGNLRDRIAAAKNRVADREAGALGLSTDPNRTLETGSLKPNLPWQMQPEGFPQEQQPRQPLAPQTDFQHPTWDGERGTTQPPQNAPTLPGNVPGANLGPGDKWNFNHGNPTVNNPMAYGGRRGPMGAAPTPGGVPGVGTYTPEFNQWQLDNLGGATFGNNQVPEWVTKLADQEAQTMDYPPSRFEPQSGFGSLFGTPTPNEKYQPYVATRLLPRLERLAKRIGFNPSSIKVPHYNTTRSWSQLNPIEKLTVLASKLSNNPQAQRELQVHR